MNRWIVGAGPRACPRIYVGAGPRACPNPGKLCAIFRADTGVRPYGKTRIFKYIGYRSESSHCG